MALGSTSQAARGARPTNESRLHNMYQQLSSIFTRTNDTATQCTRTPIDISLSNDGNEAQQPQRKRQKVNNVTYSSKSQPIQLPRVDGASKGGLQTTPVSSSPKKQTTWSQLGAQNVRNGVYTEKYSAPTSSNKRLLETAQSSSSHHCPELIQRSSGSAKTSHPASSTSGNGTKTLPFLIDECSTGELAHHKRHQNAEHLAQTSFRSTGSTSARNPDYQREKEFQRLQSLRLRQEAQNRRNNSERGLISSAASTTAGSTASRSADVEFRENAKRKLEHKERLQKTPPNPGQLNGSGMRHLPTARRSTPVVNLDPDIVLVDDDESVGSVETKHGTKVHPSKSVPLSSNKTVSVSGLGQNHKQSSGSNPTFEAPGVTVVGNANGQTPVSHMPNAVKAPKNSGKPARSLFQSLIDTVDREIPNRVESSRRPFRNGDKDMQSQERDISILREPNTKLSDLPHPIENKTPPNSKREGDPGVKSFNKDQATCGELPGQIKVTKPVVASDQIHPVRQKCATTQNEDKIGGQGAGEASRTNLVNNDDRRKRNNIADLEREKEFKRKVEYKKAQQQLQFLEREQKKAEERERAIRSQEDLKRHQDISNSQLAALETLSAATRSSNVPAHAESDAKPSKASADDTYAEPGSKEAPAAAIAEAQKRREERIEANLRANERRRQAEARDLELEDSQNATENLELQPDDTKPPHHSTFSEHHHITSDPDNTEPQGPSQQDLSFPPASEEFRPISLNSVAGQSAIAQTLQPSHKSTPKRDHGRRLGEILPQDIKILKWRKQGMSFVEMEASFFQAFGVQRKGSTLRKRHKTVQEALDTVKISKDMLDLVEAGVEEAQHQLNAIIQRQAEKLFREETLPIDAKPQHFTEDTGATQPYATPVTPPIHTAEAAGPDASFGSTAAAQSKTQDIRPQVAGKTLNAASFQHYLQIIAEERAENGCDEDEESSVTSSEDLCSFKYQVLRRELTSEELEDGERIEDQQFCLCGSPADSIVEANRKAANQLYRVGKGSPTIGTKKHSITSEHDDDGLANLELTAAEWGVVQVRVVKYVQAYERGRFRQGAVLAPRKVYLVKERRMTRKEEESDDLFGDSHETILSENTENTVFTALELANDRALRNFVKLTYRSSSANLVIRKMEIQQKENEWMQWLQEQDEGTLFHATANLDEFTSIEIKVEEGTLSGPRNI